MKCLLSCYPIYRSDITIDKNALQVFVALVVLHELTHYGDFNFNGDMYRSTFDNWDNEGYDFDMHIIGEELNDANDATLRYQQFLFKKQN